MGVFVHLKPTLVTIKWKFSVMGHEIFLIMALNEGSEAPVWFKIFECQFLKVLQPWIVRSVFCVSHLPFYIFPSWLFPSAMWGRHYYFRRVYWSFNSYMACISSRSAFGGKHQKDFELNWTFSLPELFSNSYRKKIKGFVRVNERGQNATWENNSTK